MVGEWRKLDNEEFRNLYFSQNKIRIIRSRRMRWTGHLARTGRWGMHIGFWWERKRPLRGSRRRCKDNIKMYLREK
jgi:hypothetical protein